MTYKVNAVKFGDFESATRILMCIWIGLSMHNRTSVQCYVFPWKFDHNFRTAVE